MEDDKIIKFPKVAGSDKTYDTVVIDKHHHIENTQQLVEYLDEQAPEDAFFEAYINSEDEIIGYYWGEPFSIVYDAGRMMRLCVSINDDYVVEELRRMLIPVMWHKAEDAKTDFPFPILEFTNLSGTKIIEWDNVDPVFKLRSYVFNLAKEGTPLDDFNILYPGLSVSEIIDSFKYGEYIDFLQDETLEQINNFSQVQLFCAIKEVFGYRQNVINAGKVLDVDVSERVDRLNYVLSYLVNNRLRAMGLDIPAPSNTDNDFGTQFYFWYIWWDSHFLDFADEYELDPDLIYTKEYNNFKQCPKPSFKKYVEGCESFEDFFKKHPELADDYEVYYDDEKGAQ